LNFLLYEYCERTIYHLVNWLCCRRVSGTSEVQSFIYSPRGSLPRYLYPAALHADIGSPTTNLQNLNEFFLFLWDIL